MNIFYHRLIDLQSVKQLLLNFLQVFFNTKLNTPHMYRTFVLTSLLNYNRNLGEGLGFILE